MDDADAARLVVGADARLAAQLRRLATGRVVIFAGLPGTGKSLLVHQVAHLAAAAGRSVHLLQWDVARPAFEASPAGRRYPLVDGVTHEVIRKAAGLWVRDALLRWSARHPGPEALLLGEAPFVGNRFAELARRLDDEAELLLAGPSCRFALALPSAPVRRFLEALRDRRAEHPRHAREREDAPPAVLRDLWREVAAVASRMGLGAPGESQEAAAASHPAPYDPDVYRRVYERILRHRRVDVVALDVILPTERFSVYDFAASPRDLRPTEREADAFIREVERRDPDPAALARETAHWWQT